jgi:hypothetical protein
MKTPRCHTAAALFALVLLTGPSVFAQSQVGKLFDDSISYDVYFLSGDNITNVVRSVEIIRFEEIAGKSFLVVRAAGFNLKNEDGFILFDSISAILPDRKIKVEQTKGIKYR